MYGSMPFTKSSIKMIYCTKIGFTPTEDFLTVNPSFRHGRVIVLRKGVENNIWVKTASCDKGDIKKQAINKIRQCYGLEIENITVYEGSQFTL